MIKIMWASDYKELMGRIVTLEDKAQELYDLLYEVSKNDERDPVTGRFIKAP